MLRRFRRVCAKSPIRSARLHGCPGRSVTSNWQFMGGLQHIVITVRYEPQVRYGTSLTWIAPELRDAGLHLVEDHLDDPRRSRTWAGSVDGPTFERFAKSWRLPRQNENVTASAFGDSNGTASDARTYDGMNWEDGGASPIVWVSVRVARDTRPAASSETDSPAPH